ncbi:MAG TPA: MraY family glycosyltransferase [Thermomicrobiales bacterium]|jgi:UDP-N-acetylmuramyl pentapeptide phosphotransferase/UDP-N-acetylglucosamine-1-phosphate transferase|nr:undecaprenyl/decaprenyl-phosphate alpha-N-acetylglucosaminyl 1-phosphate transferase [Chloroflexota bacterium]HBY45947.1 undecaprenyl/decaprenyl-phosphate alpha-N-acetylglucosaminyl 1-phosphate transferase [Chloroflexota bacterium]HQZ88788.1 MraY family glycosyltransferase [Thermomicrobiales bacterium]HRA32817.1 MraY family glycosyltransferase [Thermomicrobiales bacterium]
MPHWLVAAIVGIVAFAVSYTVVPRLRSLAVQANLFDMPEARRVHTKPVPRIGGLGIYLAFVVAVGVSFALPVDRFQIEVERIILLLVGATLVVGVMAFDDIVGIPPIPKLALQIIAAALVVVPRWRGSDYGIIVDQFNAPWVGTVRLPVVIAAAFTIFWIVGMMNAVNWSDGLDGLAGTIALVASVVLFLHTFFRPAGDPQFTISLLAIALAGAIIGFLPFNWYPSRIIMGDSGAMFLGFALATISVIGGAKIATTLLTMGIPILDTAWVIVYRLMHGRSPVVADRGHLHHRLLDAGLTQPQVVGCFAALTAGFGALSLLLPTRESKLYVLMLMAIGLLGVITWLARRRPVHRNATE